MNPIPFDVCSNDFSANSNDFNIIQLKEHKKKNEENK